MANIGALGVAAAMQAEEAPQQSALSSVSSTTLSGYVDTSAIWMFGGQKGAPKLYGRSYDGPAKQDGINLDVVNLALEKPLKEGGWSAGYRAELLFGPDANALASTSTLAGAADFAIKEAYVSLQAPLGNGLTIKLGVWTELLGYELLEAGSNPNFSRSFGFFLEPTIHTGALASYKVNDLLSVSGGVVERGENNAINLRSGIESLKSYTGLITFTAPASAGFLKGATVNLAILDSGLSAGSLGKTARDSQDPLNTYAGLAAPTPLKGLSVGLAWDYRANGLFDASYESALGGYLLYQATEKLKFASRTEYAVGSAGAWGVLPGPTERNVRLLGETFTADYAFWPQVLTRAELRWDHSLTGQSLFGDGNQRNAVSLALNVIYLF